MGESWENKPTEIIPGTPKDVAGLRAALINMLAGGTSTGATKYGGQINAGTNPLQTQGASMLMNMMGKGNYVPSSGNAHYGGSWGGTTLSAGREQLPTCGTGAGETFYEGCSSGGGDTQPPDCLAGSGVGLPGCAAGIADDTPNPGCFAGSNITTGGEMCGMGSTVESARGSCRAGDSDAVIPMGILSNGYKPKMAGAAGPAFGADGKPMYQNPNLMLKMMNSMPRQPQSFRRPV